MKVVKRDGRICDFDSKKIEKAILKAMQETDRGINYEVMHKIVFQIQDESYDNISVEEIQDKIEMLLAEFGRFDVAKKYVLYRNEREEIRKKGWGLTGLQRDIYEKKYRFQNETFDEFLDRVSAGNDKIRKLIRDKKFLPAGRILAGRGLNERGNKVVYSNCFVITPPEDNIESIFDTAKKMARTYSMGGGCGTSLEKLRPKGARVNNSAESTTGAVSFMDLYSLTTGLIGMKGRRGALMLTLPVSHPDILEFINVKRDLDKVTKANISVMVSDKFMMAVEANADWELKFEVETGEVISKTIPARKIFREIATASHEMAEPGIIFWDRVKNWHINSENPDFEYVSTNPCGEKPLPKGGSCMLSSFNLSEYVINPFTEDATFDFLQFKKDIHKVVEFMDDLLEEGIKYLPLKEQIESAENYRQLGIGIMGLADMFIKLGMTYGSSRSIIQLDEIMFWMINNAVKKSALLAKERGTYKAYDKESVLKSKFLRKNTEPDTFELVEKYGLRNAELLSIAPTGSLSSMWNIAGGMEPLFATHYTRKSESLGEDGEPVYYKVYSGIVEEYMKLKGLSDISELPEYFVTAMELNYKDRIRVQSTIQYYVDSAISSTINLPEGTTVEEVEEIFMQSWKNGLKGVTIYRDGCARSGILSIGSSKKKSTIDQIDELQEQIDKLVVQSLAENPDQCPMCGGQLEHSGGCETCVDCGYSPCSI